MRAVKIGTIVVCLLAAGCSKQTSKDDYMPINSAIVPHSVAPGQPITASVNCGFYSYSGDVKFLGFEYKQSAPKQFEVRAKAHYGNRNYSIALEVVVTFDTTLTLPVDTPGQYILKFYSPKDVIQTDTVMVQ